MVCGGDAFRDPNVARYWFLAPAYQYDQWTNGPIEWSHFSSGPGPGSDDIMLRSVVIIRLGLGNIL